MDTLILVGTATAYFYSLINLIALSFGKNISMDSFYFESAVFILVFISLGKYLEAITKGKTSSAIKNLMGLQPKTCYNNKKWQGVGNSNFGSAGWGYNFS